MGRKLIAIAVAAALALGMAACGEKQPPPDKRSNAEKSADNAGKALEGAAKRAKNAVEGDSGK
jgi:predicted small lipoprotein YifL